MGIRIRFLQFKNAFNANFHLSLLSACNYCKCFNRAYQQKLNEPSACFTTLFKPHGLHCVYLTAKFALQTETFTYQFVVQQWSNTLEKTVH